MEDRDMKKEYMKPAMQVVELNMNVQMLAGSLTSITTTGFSESELEDMILSEETGNPWDLAQ